MTDEALVSDLTVTIGSGEPFLIGKIRSGTIIPLGCDGALYAAFLAKGCPLTMDEVDAALDHARWPTPGTISYPIEARHD